MVAEPPQQPLSYGYKYPPSSFLYLLALFLVGLVSLRPLLPCFLCFLGRGQHRAKRKQKKKKTRNDFIPLPLEDSSARTTTPFDHSPEDQNLRAKG